MALQAPFLARASMRPFLQETARSRARPPHKEASAPCPLAADGAFAWEGGETGRGERREQGGRERLGDVRVLTWKNGRNRTSHPSLGVHKEAWQKEELARAPVGVATTDG